MDNLHKIELKGEPYVKGDFSKQKIRAQLASQEYDLEKIMGNPKNAVILEALNRTPLKDLNLKVKEGENLTFEESFLGMCYVLTATNPKVYKKLKPFIEMAYGHSQENDGRSYEDDRALAMGTSFLDGMAFKENFVRLTPNEIAGMTAASLMDIVYRVPLGEVIDTCGMGGDKGFLVDGEQRKTINVSTLSGIVLASVGMPAFKHGSYANTSAVGSTDAIEELGANINQATAEDISRVFRASNFHYSDAHLYKTIHDLSHLLKFETINHVIGPMTTPVTADTLLHRVIGVNHRVHPEDIARAYELLNQRGFQTIGNVLVVSGLDQNYESIGDIEDFEEVKEHMFLDEISPHATLLGVAQNGRYVGCTLVKPEDFGVELDEEGMKLVNEGEVIKRANVTAITGGDEANTNYLAINAALNLFAIDYLGREDAFVDGRLNGEYLREAFQRCKSSIGSGEAYRTLERYVLESHR